MTNWSLIGTHNKPQLLTLKRPSIMIRPAEQAALETIKDAYDPYYFHKLIDKEIAIACKEGQKSIVFTMGNPEWVGVVIRDLRILGYQAHLISSPCIRIEW